MAHNGWPVDLAERIYEAAHEAYAPTEINILHQTEKWNKTDQKKKAIHIINYIVQDLYVRWARTCISLSLCICVCSKPRTSKNIACRSIPIIMIDCIDAEFWHTNWWRILLHTNSIFSLCSFLVCRIEMNYNFFFFCRAVYLFFIPAYHNSLTDFDRSDPFTNHFDSCASIQQTITNPKCNYRFREKEFLLPSFSKFHSVIIHIYHFQRIANHKHTHTHRIPSFIVEKSWKYCSTRDNNLFINVTFVLDYYFYFPLLILTKQKHFCICG